MLSRERSYLESRNPDTLVEGIRPIGSICEEEITNDRDELEDKWKDIREDILVDSKRIKETGFYSDTLQDNELEEKLIKSYLNFKTSDTIIHDIKELIAYIGRRIEWWDKENEEEFYRFVEEVHSETARELNKHDYRNTAVGVAVLKLANGTEGGYRERLSYFVC